jgi:hypothetical protein
MAYSQQIDVRQDQQLYEHQTILAKNEGSIKKIDNIYANQILMCAKFDLDCR